MNAPLISRTPLKLGIAKGLQADLEVLTDEAFRAFSAAIKFAEETLPELIADQATSKDVFALFVVRSGEARLFIEFSAATESFVVTGFEIDDFDPPTSPTAQREVGKARVRTVLARLRLEADALSHEKDLRLPNKPSRALVRAATPRPGNAYAFLTVRHEIQKALYIESGLARERRPRRRSAFFGEWGISGFFIAAEVEMRGTGASYCTSPKSGLSGEDRFSVVMIDKTQLRSACVGSIAQANGMVIIDGAKLCLPSLSSSA